MKNILTVFAAVMISLLMLCGCSENDIGEIEGTYVGTDISRYIDIEEEPTETLSEAVPEDDPEASDDGVSKPENSEHPSDKLNIANNGQATTNSSARGAAGKGWSLCHRRQRGLWKHR